MRCSAGNIKRSKVEIDADPEPEDEYGYTSSEFNTFNIFLSNL
jgi:hypothetical protein